MTTPVRRPSAPPRPGKPSSAPSTTGVNEIATPDVGELALAEAMGAEPRDQRYLAGDVIDRKYRLTRVLGEGGMGAVWLARNLSLDVDVAIKLIRREIARPETSQRLLQEARAAARLKHASIVRVFDFGESERGDPFIVMEVLTGESLRDVLDRKARLPATAAVRTLLPVASALAAAHAQGIVHRDLKPDNVVLITDETGAVIPKVVDFGIAKLRQDGVDGKITVAGTVMGSPDYMSPEQARGRDEIDERTDVWAMSVVLYETVTGKTPFFGENYNALLTSILSDDPLPITEYAAGDADLWSILSHGLTKDRNARWPTMRDLGGALATWLLKQGYETDVVGTSLHAHWLGNPDRRSLPDTPPSVRRVATPETMAPPAIADAMDRITIEPPEARAPAGSAPTLSGGAAGAERMSPTPMSPPSDRSPARGTSLAGGEELAARPLAPGGFGRWVWAAAIAIPAVALWLAVRSPETQPAPQAPSAAAVTPTVTPPVVTSPPAPSAPAPAPAPSASAAPAEETSAQPSKLAPPRHPVKPPSVPSAKPGKPKGLEIPDAPNF